MNPPHTLKIRLSGNQNDVDTVAKALADHFDIVADPSRPYPNRRDTGVRVYLEVHPR